MVSTTGNVKLPERVTNFEEARAKHGTRADFMLDMLQVGDPLADAVILEVNELGKEAKRQLNQGILHGLDSVENPPPAIAAFLTQIATMPEWIDHDTVAAGDVPDLSLPPVWKALASSGLSLAHVYASPGIAKLLVQTGQLTTMAERRLVETGMWKNQTVLPGALLRGAPGYVGTVQVRLLHARVRHTAMRHGWDSAEWGVPINQTDVARTWFAFTIVPFLYARAFGMVFSEQEQAQHYRFWSYLAHVLGLDERFHLDIRSDAAAEELLDLLDSTIGEPDDNARALTEAMLESNATTMSAGPLSMLDRATVRDLFNGLLRHVHGDRFADGLHLPRSRNTELLPLLGAVSAQSWALQHRTPETTAAAREEFTAVIASLVAENMPDHTAYQAHISPEAHAA